MWTRNTVQQDYHFALLPAIVKQRLPHAAGFQFWHIPWPNYEAFRICPWKEQILRGLCGNDLLAFHIQHQFLRAFVVRYDAALFSLPKFARRLPIPQYLWWPSIDPLSPKNEDLAPETVRATLDRLNLPHDRPIVLQVSRFDRFKDPIGVIKAFALVRRRVDCVLVLAGGGADDDPEGAAVLAEVRAAAEGVPDVHILLLPSDAHRDINALQRAAAVVVQKSAREGFGLTVTEAMRKGRPVVGGHAGGIATQILHGTTGFLVGSPEGCAFRILSLLENPDLPRRLGTEAREHVRRNFLITRNLRDYLVLLTLLRRRAS